MVISALLTADVPLHGIRLSGCAC